jgi:predicted TIM-barrel fold metal-dependent hydrolase
MNPAEMSKRVIDFHVHVGQYCKLRNDIRVLLDRTKKERDFDLELLFSSPRDLAKYLKEQGVEKAVLLAEEGPGTNFHITTDFVCDFRDEAEREGKDLFIAFGNINPNRTLSLHNKYESDLRRGIRGYKLYPADHNFHPITDELMSLYRRFEEDGLILMFHTGTTAQEDGVDDYGNPALFRPILDEFPNLRVVFAHAGKPIFCEEAAYCAAHYENCYLDTAFIAPDKLLGFLPDIRKFSDKVLFGSDWPAGVRSLSDHLSGFYNEGLSAEEVDRILFSNAARVLHLH